MVPFLAIISGLGAVVATANAKQKKKQELEEDYKNLINSSYIYDISLEKLPEVISSKINDISLLENKIRSSEKSANSAMDFVNDQMNHYQLKKRWGIFEYRAGNTKDIIEDTQRGLEKLAEANQVNVDALRESFLFQKKLADTTKYLFKLGCANIAMNRIAVREIEMRLSDASEEEISELARQELMVVVEELKQQEDMLAKIDFLASTVKAHEETISLMKNDYSDRISENQSNIRELLDFKTQRNDLDKEQLKAFENLQGTFEKKIESIAKNKKFTFIAIIISSIALTCSLIGLFFQFIL